MSQYVPILKFKQGEWQALGGLDAPAAAQVTPLLEVTPSTDSFDDPIDYLQQRVGGKLAPRWDGEVFLDVTLLESFDNVAPRDAFQAAIDASEGSSLTVVPAVSPSSGAHVSGAADIAHDHGRLCLRVSPSDMLVADVDDLLMGALRECGLTPDSVDLVLDCGDNVDRRDSESMLQRVPRLDDWRSLTLAGGSFERPQGSGEFRVPREHLRNWSTLSGGFSRDIQFGDYASAEPAYQHFDGYVEIVPMVIYTAPQEWLVVRGQRVRIHGWEQTKNLAGAVVASADYCGSSFSPGDEWLAQRSAGTNGTGNSTKLVEVRTSHHLTHVVSRDLASPGGP